MTSFLKLYLAQLHKELVLGDLDKQFVVLHLGDENVYSV